MLDYSDSNLQYEVTKIYCMQDILLQKRPDYESTVPVD